MGASLLANLVATAQTFATAQKIVIEVSGRTLEAELHRRRYQSPASTERIAVSCYEPIRHYDRMGDGMRRCRNLPRCHRSPVLSDLHGAQT